MNYGINEVSCMVKKAPIRYVQLLADGALKAELMFHGSYWNGYLRELPHLEAHGTTRDEVIQQLRRKAALELLRYPDLNRELEAS